MLYESLVAKFALSQDGARKVERGAVWTVIVDLVDMAGIALLYLLMRDLMAWAEGTAPAPAAAPYLVGVVVYAVVSLLAHDRQYANTYSAVYGEVEQTRLGLAERLRRLPLSFFGSHDPADLVETLLGDVAKLEHVWSHVLSYLIGSVVSTAVMAVVLCAFDWRLAIACLWGVPVALAAIAASHRSMVRSAEVTREAGVRVAEGVQELLENVRELRAFNLSGAYVERLDQKIDSFEQTTTHGEVRTGLAVNGAQAVMRLGLATTVVTGVALLGSGQVSFMTLFAFLLVATRVYLPFDQALGLMAELFSSEAAVRRLNRVREEPLMGGTTEFDPHCYDISFEEVGFSYEGQEGAALRHVSFVAEEGKVTALVGPSGSGKSTCARLAARFWDADSGRITVGGCDISGIDPETLLSRYSMVFQDVMLFDGSVMDNIRIGRRGATDEEVLAAAHAACCDDFVSRLPEGYDTPIGENGALLSGGERQRISIARALLKDAPIVLLDEATAALDAESETQVQQALTTLLANKTVLVIAHRMRTVRRADKVVVLKDGSVCEQGSPDELMGRPDGLFRRMCELQQVGDAWSIGR